MRTSEALSHIYEMRPHFVRIASCDRREVRGEMWRCDDEERG